MRGATGRAHPASLLRRMAVPKQKQSHARTTQRRSQHKVKAATYNACPTCHSPRIPHRVCPVCGSYRGREVIAEDRPAVGLAAHPMVTVAVDAGGADLGPAEVAAGAAIAAAAGTRVLLFGPAGEIGSVPDGVEVVDAPVSIAKAADPAFAVRSTPEASIVQAAKAVAAGAGPGAGLRRLDRLGAGRRAVQHAPRPRDLPSRAGPAGPVPGGRPVMLLDVGANVTCRPEHLVQFAHMGSAFSRRCSASPRPGWRSCPTARRRSRARRSWWRSTSSSPARAGPG